MLSPAMSDTEKVEQIGWCTVCERALQECSCKSAPDFTKPWPLAGTQTSVRYRPELLQRVDAIAKAAGVSRTLVLNRMVAFALAQAREGK